MSTVFYIPLYLRWRQSLRLHLHTLPKSYRVCFLTNKNLVFTSLYFIMIARWKPSAHDSARPVWILGVCCCSWMGSRSCSSLSPPGTCAPSQPREAAESCSWLAGWLAETGRHVLDPPPSARSLRVNPSKNTYRLVISIRPIHYLSRRPYIMADMSIKIKWKDLKNKRTLWSHGPPCLERYCLSFTVLNSNKTQFVVYSVQPALL